MYKFKLLFKIHFTTILFNAAAITCYESTTSIKPIPMG
jgi:hypothetical protein